jgi:hypothetical protein
MKASQGVVDQAIELWTSGMNTYQIAEHLPVAPTTVQSWLKARGLRREKQVRRKRYSPQDISKVESMYAERLGIDKISDATGISNFTVYRWLQEKDLLRTRSEAGAIRRSSHYIQWGQLTAERAWILGLIFGDGSVYRDLSRVSLCAAYEDREVLDKVQRILGSTYTVGQAGKGRCIRISIGSSDLARKLVADYGLDADKCRNMRWPNIPPQLVPDFVRGLIDSDGCWSILGGKRGRTRLVFTYCSISIQFVRSLEMAIRESCAINEHSVYLRPAGNCIITGVQTTRSESARIHYNHSDAVSIGRWVYAGDTEHMRCARKFDFWHERSQSISL